MNKKKPIDKLKRKERKLLKQPGFLKSKENEKKRKLESVNSKPKPSEIVKKQKPQPPKDLDCRKKLLRKRELGWRRKRRE